MIETFDVMPSAGCIMVSNSSPATGSPYGGSSSFRVGWRNVDVSGYAFYYNAFFSLDWAEFADRGVSSGNFISAKIILSNVAGSTLTTSLYKILKPITSSLDWQTYNGTNSWSVAGGTGSGTDRSSSALMNMAAVGTHELSLSFATLSSIHVDDWKFGIYTTSSKPQFANYINLVPTNTIIRISYHHYGMGGDATMF